MAANNNGLEWFRPMWRRVALLAFILVWVGWEWLYTKDQFWGLLTLGLLAYAVWTFFVTFDKRVGPPKEATEAPPPPQAPDA